MIWTPSELARLKGLRDREREPEHHYTSYWDTPLGHDAEYRDALVNADPLARIEEQERRTCDKCEHHVMLERPDLEICGKHSKTTYPVSIIPCSGLGFSCGAFKEKTHAKDEA